MTPRSAHPAWGYAVAAALTVAATVIAVAIDSLTPIPNLSLIFVLPVVIAAVSYGWGPSAAAAGGGALCYNYFLIEPRYSLRVDDAANVWALALLLIVGAIVSVVAARSRRQALEAMEAAEKAAALEALANALASAKDRSAIAAAAAEALGRLFRSPAVVLLRSEGALALAAKTADAQVSDHDLEAADWVAASGLASRAQTYPIEAAGFDFWPIVKPAGVLGVAFAAEDRSRPAAADHLIQVVSGYLAVALERASHAKAGS